MLCADIRLCMFIVVIKYAENPLCATRVHALHARIREMCIIFGRVCVCVWWFNGGTHMLTYYQV